MSGLDIDVNLKLASFQTGISKMTSDFNRMSSDLTGKASSLEKALTAIPKGLTGLAVGAVGALTLAKGFESVKGSLDWADTIAETSSRLGITTAQLQRLQSVGVDLNSSDEGITSAFEGFNNTLGLADAGASKAIKAISLLGSEFEAFSKSGASQEAIFLKAVEAISKYDDAATRGAVAAKVLGNGGADVVQGFRDQGKSADGLRVAMDRLNVVADAEIQKASQLNDRWEKFSHTMGVSVKGAIISVADSISGFADKFSTSLEGKISELEASRAALEATPEGGLFDASRTQQLKLLTEKIEGFKAAKKFRDELTASELKGNQVASGGRPAGAGSLGKEDGSAGESKKLAFTVAQFEKSESIIRRLRSEFALTREQAAGFVGNLFHESAGLNTKAVSGDGYNSVGLAQWTFERKTNLEKFARETKRNVEDFNTQEDFLVKELKTSKVGKRTIDRLRLAENLNDSTTIVQNSFEKPDPKLAHTDRRIAAAQTALAGAEGFTSSELKFEENKTEALRKEHEKQLDEALKHKEDLAGVFKQLAVDVDVLKLPEGQREQFNEFSRTIERLGLAHDNLSASEKGEIEAVRASIEAKYNQLAINDKTEASLERLAELQDIAVQGAISDSETIFQVNAAYEARNITLDKYLELLAKIDDTSQSGAAKKELQDTLTDGFNRTTEAAEEATDNMSVFANQAARNMQTAFADFLFDPFKDGIEGMAIGFGRTIQRMLADAASAELMKTLFGSFGGGAKGDSGLIGAGISALTSAVGGFSFFADGGIANRATLISPGNIAGEAGAEAVIPLKNGSVPVRLTGGAGRGDNTISNNYVINVSVQGSGNPDDDGKRAGEAAVRAIVRQEIQNSARPGNRLNKLTNF